MTAGAAPHIFCSAMASPSVGPPGIGPGSVVIAYLNEPREKIWGLLLALDAAGVTLKGIDLRSFDDWMRSSIRPGEGAIALSTAFYPLARVEKILLDEAAGDVPSLDDQCLARTGMSLRDHVAGRRAPQGVR